MFGSEKLKEATWSNTSVVASQRRRWREEVKGEGGKRRWREDVEGGGGRRRWKVDVLL